MTDPVKLSAPAEPGDESVNGSTALAQVRAAYRYFLASGADWSPWECKP